MKNIIKNPNVRIPMYFVLFFLVIAVLDGIFVYKAVSSHRGVVTENAYEKGLKYNEAIGRAEDAEAVKQTISFKELGNKKAEITYIIEQEITADSVNLKAIRPVENGVDFETKLLKNNSENSYSAILEFPEKGIWDLLIIASDKNAEFRKKQRIFIKE